MKIVLLKAASIDGVLYPAGETPRDVDPGVGWDLIDRKVARFWGPGVRTSYAWTDLTQSAAGVNPAGATAPAVIDQTETGWPGTLLFAGNADILLCGQWQVIHEWAEGTPLRPHIHWMLTAPSAAAVGWEFYYRISGIGAAAGAWVGPSAGTLAVSHGGLADVHALTTFADIPLPGETVSVIVAWRLYRRGNTDANNDDVRLLSIDAHFLKDATGSIQEYTK